MNREPSFPFDWISPSEYRYCSCGMRLIPKDVIICAYCFGNCFGNNMDMCISRKVSLEACNREHERLTTEREALARQRQEDGIVPLFWM